MRIAPIAATFHTRTSIPPSRRGGPMATERPNILFIMSDQHRHDWFGAAGASHVSTPHLDALAARGTRFTRCGTPSAIWCAGPHLPRLGSPSPSTRRMGERGDPPARRADLLPATPRRGLSRRVLGKTRSRKVEPATTGCAAIGRRRSAGDSPIPSRPEGKMLAGSSPTPIGPYTAWLDGRGLLTRFHEDYRARSRTRFIARNHDSVLPADALRGYLDRRSRRRVDRWSPRRLPVAPVRELRRTARSIRSAGNLRRPLPERADASGPRGRHDGKARVDQETVRRCHGGGSRRRATAVFRLSHPHRRRDRAYHGTPSPVAGGRRTRSSCIRATHGEMLGDHGIWTKHCAYEASHRRAAHCGGTGLPAGMTSDALVELEDVGPTICDLAGIPPIEGIDARSIVPILRGERVEHRDAIVVMEGAVPVDPHGDAPVHREHIGRPGDVRSRRRSGRTRNIADRAPDLARSLAHRLRERMA